MPRPLCAIFFCLFAVFASAQVQNLGDVSFAVPEGWKYEYKPGNDYATMTVTSGPVSCVVIITRPVASSGNAERDFASAWRSLVERNPQAPLPSPIYEIRGLPGYPGRYSSATVNNRTKNAFLYVLETGRNFVPVVVMTPNRGVFDSVEHVVMQILSSVRLAPLRAVPIKANISMADLAGDWKHGDASVVSYVNSSSGNYAGSSATFYGDTYHISANGAYSYSFQGMTGGHVVREKSSGRVEFSQGFLVFRENPSNRTRRYRFISYQQGLSGAILLTILPESYPPTPSNINMYGEKWVRDAPGR